jgi:hypothetical protein
MLDWINKAATELSSLAIHIESMNFGQRCALYIEVSKALVKVGAPIWIFIALGSAGLGFVGGYYLGVH